MQTFTIATFASLQPGVKVEQPQLEAADGPIDAMQVVQGEFIIQW